MASHETSSTSSFSAEDFDLALSELEASKQEWAELAVEERIKILQDMKDALAAVAEDWAMTAARHKQIPEDSALEGEEWLFGPYAMMCGLNALIETLSQLTQTMEGARERSS